jgi:glutathione S-transferase
MSASKPVLWHIPVSHYSEKARWALDYKGVEHERRAPMPGAHMAIAGWLTRGQTKTFPVLALNGRRVGDSTAIIAALEERVPDPPLYPDDPAELSRALELEEFFDENLGPQIRLLAWHELRRDPDRMADLAQQMAPRPLSRLPGSRAFARTFSNTFVQLRYRVAADDAADEARAMVLAALDRLDAELEASDGDYLVGDSFSVADLTAAALFYPMVNPPEGPAMIADHPPPLEEFYAPLRDRPGYAYVERMYRDHRR